MVEKSRAVDLAAMRAAARLDEEAGIEAAGRRETEISSATESKKS